MTVVGIDFGTSNSAIATMQNGRVEIVTNREGRQATPSVVYFTGSELDDVLVGDAAVHSAALDPARAADCVRRQLGRDFEFRIDGNAYSAVELCAAILRQLICDAEEYLAERVTDAVITVPACFTIRERAATKKAAEMAGITVRALCSEPVAAAVDFAHCVGEQLHDKTILVYRLGAGTFDATVGKVRHNSPFQFQVLAMDGSSELGGVDWDLELARFVASEFADTHGGRNPEEDRASFHRLLWNCRRPRKRSASERRLRSVAGMTGSCMNRKSAEISSRTSLAHSLHERWT